MQVTRLRGPIPENQIDSAMTRDSEITPETWIFPSLGNNGFLPSASPSDFKPICYRKHLGRLEMKGWITNPQQVEFVPGSSFVLFSFPNGYFVTGERRSFLIRDVSLRMFGFSIAPGGGCFLGISSTGSNLSIPAGNLWAIEISMPL